MTGDNAYWVGLAAGALLGTVATWLTIAIAIALGRLLAYRAMRTSIATPADDDTTWNSLDIDYRHLIEQENGR